MRNAWLIALAGSLLLSAAACHRKSQAEQLAALDSAYQSGVLTKDEYDAKRRALLGPAAAPPAPVPPSVAAAPKPTPFPSAVPAPATGEPKNSPPTAPPASATVRGPDQEEPEPAPSTGCEDAEYASRKEQGLQARFFAMPPASVRKAAIAALQNLDFNIRDDTANAVVATKRRHLGAIVGAGGERVILRFTEVRQGSQPGTRLTAETKRSFIGRATQKSWTSAVLAETACLLRQGASRH